MPPPSLETERLLLRPLTLTDLERAAQLIDRGATTAQALAALSRDCGTPARSLVDALSDHDRYGTPLGPSLDRVAIEGRLHRRRRAEEAVTLLFPLVLTTLPAFVLSTVGIAAC